MATVKTLPTIETSNDITTKHRNFFGKLFGARCPQTNPTKEENKAAAIYDIIDDPERFKRSDDSHFSDFTEPNQYKKSTLPIIMDTTTSTNNGKKHIGYADIQSRTTMVTISPKMSKKRGKFKTLLNKIFHKKQNGKQKRNALAKLHRELSFSPFRQLKKIFQGSSTNQSPSELTDDPRITNSNKLYSTKAFSNKNIYPTKDYGGFNIEDIQKQFDWKPLKQDKGFGFTPDENVRKYSTLKYNPNYFKTNDYIETIEPDNESLSFYNKYQNQVHHLIRDNVLNKDFMCDLKLGSCKLPFIKNTFSQFPYGHKSYPGLELDPNANLDSYSKKMNVNLGPNTKNSKFETIPDYDQINTNDAKNIVPKYGNGANIGPRYSSSALWLPRDTTDGKKKLEESKAPSKANAGKLNMTNMKIDH